MRTPAQYESDSQERSMRDRGISTVPVQKPMLRWRVVFYVTATTEQSTIVEARTSDEARTVAKAKVEQEGVPFRGTTRTPRRLKLGVDEALGRLINGRIFAETAQTLAGVAATDIAQSFDLEAAERHLTQALADIKAARRAYADVEAEA